MIIRIIFLSLVCINILSCSAKYESRETKKDSALHNTTNVNEKELMSTGIYNVTIEPNTNIVPITCNGSGIAIKLYSDQSISLSGVAHCTTILGISVADPINLGKSLQSSDLKEDESTPEVKEMKGIITRAKNIATDSNGDLPLGGYIFTPARPHIINPLTNLNNLDDMEDMYTENSSVTVRTSDGKTINDSGVFGIRYLGSSTNVPSGATKIEASKDNKIIHFTVDTLKNGFSSIPQRGNFMLFESREMWMGTSPVVIYKMVLKSRLNDMVEGMSTDFKKAWVTNGGQCETTITFNLVSFTVASDDEDDEDEDEDED